MEFDQGYTQHQKYDKSSKTFNMDMLKGNLIEACKPALDPSKDVSFMADIHLQR